MTNCQTNEDGAVAPPTGKEAGALRKRFRRETFVGTAEPLEEDSDDSVTTHKVVTTKVIEERTRTPKGSPKKKEDDQESTTVVTLDPKIIETNKVHVDEEKGNKVKLALKGVGRKLLNWVGKGKPKRDGAAEDNAVQKKTIVIKEDSDGPQVAKVTTLKPVQQEETIIKPVEEETIVARRVYKLGENTLPPQTKDVKRTKVVVNKDVDLPKETKIKILRPVEEKQTDEADTIETVVTTTQEKNIRPKPAEVVEVQVLKVEEAPETGTVIKTRERVVPKVKVSESDIEEGNILVKKVIPLVSEPVEEPIVLKRSRPPRKDIVQVEDMNTSKSETSTQTIVTTRENKVVSQLKKNSEAENGPQPVPKVAIQPQLGTLPAARPAVLPNNVPQTPAAVGPLSILTDSFVKNTVKPANLFAQGVFTTA